MRKIIIIINIAFVLVFLAGIESSLIDKGKTVDSTQSSSIELNLAIEKNVSPNSTKYVTNSLEKVPINILKTFNKDGWSFILLKEISFQGDDYDVDTTGLIDYVNKNIQIKSTNDGQETSITLHEIGHYIDWQNNFISSSDEFKALYNKYKDGKYIEFEYSLSTAPKEEMLYATKNERELFASICKDKILAPQYLKKQYPDLYEYLDNIFRLYN